MKVIGRFAVGTVSIAAASLCGSGLALARTAAAPPAKETTSRIAEARRALDDNLLDYRATRLRDVHLVQSPAGFAAFCGEINTTNRLGGYSGWNKFIIPLGNTPIGNLLDKVAIAGQPSAASGFFAQYSDAKPTDLNGKQIATHCGQGTPIDKVDYAPVLAFGSAG